MNEALNNIFDDESLEAIRNADKINPRPEIRQEQENFTSEKPSKIEVQAENVAESSDMKRRIERLEKENQDLKIKVTAQKELIHKIIESQNTMIKELNDIYERIHELENRKPAIQASSPTPTKQEAPKQENDQQTSAGEGLNPNDFAVEKIFYTGNK